ncbi:MAG: hypothetical protein M3525_02965 [Acidobacteriota bacterium]|nr:hypothetical protein [Acidobacteriota bacterium]
MVEKLTVIFFVLLFLIAGILLTVLPWVNVGAISDWGNNYLLALAARKTGLTFLQSVVASGWFRGAVSGLGILNLFFAFWEIAHFKQNVQMLAGKEIK